VSVSVSPAVVELVPLVVVESSVVVVPSVVVVESSVVVPSVVPVVVVVPSVGVIPSVVVDASVVVVSPVVVTSPVVVGAVDDPGPSVVAVDVDGSVSVSVVDPAGGGHPANVMSVVTIAKRAYAMTILRYSGQFLAADAVARRECELMGEPRTCVVVESPDRPEKLRISSRSVRQPAAPSSGCTRAREAARPEAAADSRPHHA